MARKLKIPPSTEVAAAAPMPELAASDEASAPARRGRKLKAAAPSPTLLPAVGIGNPSTDDVEADVPAAVLTKTPGRRGPGRKQEQAAAAKSAALPPDTAVEQASAEADPSAAEPKQAQAENDVLVAERSFPPDAAGAGDAVHGSARADAAPAAQWDRATDAVEFDRPTIERVAAQGGPNQGMAKLLVAARAEGGGSRWPF